MTKSIIEMAREAGAVFPADGSYHQFERHEDLEAFAKLVREDEREKFLGALRQLHDSYSLASDPSGLKERRTHEHKHT
jgi:hypothetical protein